jgi:acyl-CoA synthetase (AMP-forming)/AMP-acid ligase II/acyl carrier protein
MTQFDSSAARHPPRTIRDLLAESIRRHSAATAILAPGRRSLSYEALGRQIAQTEEALARAGIGRDSRIGLAVQNGPEYAVALLATVACATCAPLNPALDEAALVRLLGALRLNALIAPDGADTPAVRAARKAGVAVLGLRHAQTHPAGTFELITTCAGAATKIAFPGVDDLALLMHTSGTTGKPKIVPFEQWRITEAARNRIQQGEITSSDRGLAAIAFYSNAGIRRGLLPPLLVGGSVICPASLDAETLVDSMEKLAPTYYFASAATHIAVLETIERRGRPLEHSLRLAFTGAAALPAPVRRRLEHALGIPIVTAYGMTETGTIAQTPLPPAKAPDGAVGLPTFLEVRIADQDGCVLGPDQTGEIIVRGAEVAQGYENDESANSAAFRNGWFRTGDWGRVDGAGFVYLSGRIKDVINRGGAKVSPAEVEGALAEHPQVVEAAVFAVDHPTLGEDVAAAIVPRTLAVVEEDELREFVRARLAAFKVPTRIIALPVLPRGPLGKVDRTELARIAEPHLRAEFVPPRDSDEIGVATIFADVLALARVGANDNFFHLGGDSLRASRVLARVQAAFGVSLVAAEIFRFPTVSGLADAIKAARIRGTDHGPPQISARRRESSPR